MESNMRVGYANLRRTVKTYRKEISDAITECLDNSYYIKGPKLAEFEEILSAYCGRSAVGVSNGTSALLLAYEQMGIGPGDKVIVPSFTFISTAEMLSKLGAVPVWVDCNMDNYTLNIQDLENKMNKNIKAIVGVDIFGHTCDYDAIKKIAKAYNVPVIQDAAQSFGGSYKGKINGSYNDIVTFSFYPAKNLWCLGDGGAVVSKKSIAKKVKMACDHGRTDKYVHEFLGWNERLDAIQASVLTKFMRHVDDWNRERRRIAKIYDNSLNTDSYVKSSPDCVNVYNQYTIRVANRDKVIGKLDELGVECGIMWPYGLHQQKPYADKTTLPNTETVAKEILSLPCYPGMGFAELDFVIDKVNQVLQN